MKFQIQPGLPAAPMHPTPAAPGVRIERLVVEGLGPLSAAGVRAGFREAWLGAGHADGAWTSASSERFRAPLALSVPPGLGGRELGRRLAEAILRRGQNDGQP